MTQKPSIAITGATGFLGGHVAKALCEQGFSLRALVRDPARATHLHGLGMELVSGDLNHHNALAQLVQDCTNVIHIAGAIKAKTEAQLIAINGGGTTNLVAAMAKSAPDARLVHISSIAAREPQLSAYAASKAASEAAANIHGGPLVIVRPNAIYGPGDTETLAVFKLAKDWLHPVLHQPKAKIAMIHGLDAANAIMALCANNAPTGMFEISDEQHQGYSWYQITEAAVRAVGTTYQPVPIPASVMQFAGAVSEGLGRFRRSAPIFNRGKVREMLHGDWSTRPALRIPSEIWQPQITLDAGFAQTVAWYRSEGWL